MLKLFERIQRIEGKAYGFLLIFTIYKISDMRYSILVHQLISR